VDRLLSVKDAARTLRIGYRTTLALCLKHDRGEDGGIKSVRIGKARRIRPADLEDFIGEPTIKRRNTKGRKTL
jgi:excisionase family DNA binding protein